MDRSEYSKELVEEMNRYYDARAPMHDFYMSYESLEKMETLLSPIIEVVEKWVVGKRVLEIACGTGNWTQVLAKRAASVTAMDCSPKALEIAAPKLAEHKNITITNGDAYDLDSLHDRFDVVFASDWWSHIPKGILPNFIESVLSRLRRGGKAIFLDMSFKEFFREESSYQDQDNNRVSLRSHKGVEYRVVKNFPTESELRQILEPYSQAIVYHQFDSLERWLVIFEPR